MAEQGNWETGDGIIFEIPEFLAPGQNVYHQPPFVWLLNHDTFFPPDAFPKRERVRELLTVLGQAYEQGPNFFTEDTVDMFIPKDTRKIYNPKHRNGVYAAEHLNTLLHFFLTYHPYVPEYIWTLVSDGKVFNPMGNRSKWSEKESVRSYAAFEERKITLHKSQRMFGIELVAPAFFATADDVLAALPDARESNRWFRLVNHSEALR